MNAPLEDLRRWVLELRSQDIDGAEFLSRIEARRAHYNRVLEAVGSLEIPQDMEAEVQEELLAGRRGIQGFLEALGALSEWERSRASEDLDRALALATQANSLLNQAVSMNWKTFQTYQEAAEEFLAQVGYEGPSR
jgi:hypothetical protein